MIVNWTENRIKVVPIKDADGIAASHVVLAPGYNDVPDADWKAARDTAKQDIDTGRIKEEWIKAEKAKEAQDAVLSMEIEGALCVPAQIKDITRKNIKDVIEDTQHLPTLKKWEEEELRQDVRLYIIRQLDKINNPGE